MRLQGKLLPLAGADGHNRRMAQPAPSAIALFPSVSGSTDPATHFWYEEHKGHYLRLCDGLEWEGMPSVRLSSYIPCLTCKDLYIGDIAGGQRRLLLLPDSPVPPPPTVIYSLRDGGAPHQTQGGHMQISNIPMTTFARFYEATGPQKVSMVRDARLYQTDPKGWAGRDYYRELRLALRNSHWQTDDIASFEAALEPLLESQQQAGRREHFEKIGRAYIKFWKKNDARLFDTPSPSVVTLGGLGIRLSNDLGMRRSGDSLVLKVWWNAPRPTRAFRQAVQYLTGRGKDGWHADWHGALWDVRREEILPPVNTPKDLYLALEGQAGAFREIWASLDAAEAPDDLPF